MPAFFVTATGTDVGKTYVTAGLLRHLRGLGMAAQALKPVASGVDDATLADSDPGVLLAAMGEAVSPQTVARICPWRFAAPLSPDMAAARAGQSIDFEALLQFCRARLGDAQGPMFIEGVGGVMVPLDARHTARDWMAALGLPLILVAGSYLGTISHTLTALDAMARAQLKVAALVVNESTASPVPVAEMIATIARFAPHIPICALKRNETQPGFAAMWDILSRAGARTPYRH